jgi:hypothetical protein
LSDEPTKLFLAGVPASGKSTFGEWLEANHGFVHIDAELPGRLARFDLAGSWDHFLRTGDRREFLLRIRALNRPVLFNWGFPVSYLPVVMLLKTYGFVPWWFDADREQARRANEQRKTVSLDDFETQMAGISREWSNIESCFAPNILNVLDSAGRRLPPSAIFESIRRAV